MSRGQIVTLILATTAMLAVATMDARVANSVHARNLGPAVRGSRIAMVVKWPGDYRFTLVVAAFVVAVNAKRWPRGVLIAVSGIVAGLLYTITKWCIGRSRPYPRNHPAIPPFEFHPFPHGFAGLWKAENMAFPSGHTCLAFATAEALSLLFPRGRIGFYIIATLVGVERVLEGAHYPSDAVGGAILGMAGAWGTAGLLVLLLPPSREPRGFEVLPPAR
jgi:membrane-associated phospholipid phosphatase